MKLKSKSELWLENIKKNIFPFFLVVFGMIGMIASGNDEHFHLAGLIVTFSGIIIMEIRGMKDGRGNNNI